jgi:hypothetical protein
MYIILSHETLDTQYIRLYLRHTKKSDLSEAWVKSWARLKIFSTRKIIGAGGPQEYGIAKIIALAALVPEIIDFHWFFHWWPHTQDLFDISFAISLRALYHDVLR